MEGRVSPHNMKSLISVKWLYEGKDLAFFYCSHIICLHGNRSLIKRKVWKEERLNYFKKLVYKHGFKDTPIVHVLWLCKYVKNCTCTKELDGWKW